MPDSRQGNNAEQYKRKVEGMEQWPCPQHGRCRAEDQNRVMRHQQKPDETEDVESEFADSFPHGRSALLPPHRRQLERVPLALGSKLCAGAFHHGKKEGDNARRNQQSGTEVDEGAYHS